MEPFWDIEKVKKTFSQGHTDVVESQTGYKYSMAARCPKCGSFASVSRIEKAGPSLSKVIFQCTSCFTEFEVKQDDIYIC